MPKHYLSMTTSPETQTNGSSDSEYEACLHAMQLTNSFAFSWVLRAAVELQLFDIIAKFGHGAWVSSSEVASKLPTEKNPEAASMIDRILCLVCSNGLLNCSLRTHEDGSFERFYSLTTTGHYFAKDKDGATLFPLVLLGLDQASTASWYLLKDTILRGGSSFREANGMSIFQYMNTNPEFNKIFNAAMANNSSLVMSKILDTYKGFEDLTSLVDVAGGTGKTLNAIVSRYPTIKGINFDLPHVIANAPSYPGIEHVGGDMLVSIPKGDAIIVKNAFHNWSDKECTKILKNCYDALPENGRLIIMDIVLPAVPDDSTSHKILFQMDTIMLAQPGGKERTEKEFRNLVENAGFKQFQVMCCAYTVSLIEISK